MGTGDGGDFEGVNETGTKAGNGSKGESKGSHRAETEGNGGELHQAKKGTNQAKNRTKDNAKSKTKTEIEGSHKAKTKGNSGDLHQAKMGTGDGGDFEGTGDDLHQAETKADTKARTRFYQDGIVTNLFQAETEGGEQQERD